MDNLLNLIFYKMHIV